MKDGNVTSRGTWWGSDSLMKLKDCCGPTTGRWDKFTSRGAPVNGPNQDQDLV
ncbi:hypothetical protein PHLCEN_2v4146 [Hermanssonia centrifuga]|uniref:Uncharacterized protein n=1 Tax=Hermanssonia centrifuga TaxID=98765 RepID=A0A2R6PZ45_9APHY|nr:hypothetical protein PHLCEN_2v4146 [Hermanssonia centrifuga]